MQSIILAAGLGKRLKELTENNTKCMVKVNGITMIERALRILDKKNLSKIVIVVGYKGDNLISFVSSLDIKTPIVYVKNPIYNKTNNIYSLALAKDYLQGEDTLLLESDLIFEEAVIDALLNDKRPTLALVDKFQSWMDGTCMKLDDDDSIADFIPGKLLRFADKEDYYKTVNIYKFSKNFSTKTYVPFLTAYETAMGENEYYESVIKLIALLETKEIRAKRLSGEVWYEIDNIQDLDIAETLFAKDGEERYQKIMRRYGGFWRYPKLLDFCYLVNPYYPPEKMKEEMKSNFDVLLTQYPSGMDVNSLLVAGAFGVREKHIVVGNGAAELIKSLMEKTLDEKAMIGCIYPTFEEYPNRYDKSRIVPFIVSSPDFRYSVGDLIDFYDNKKIALLVLITPDNPSGNYIPKDDLLSLINWAKKKDTALIVDESFVDFVSLEKGQNTEDLTLLDEKILALYNKLYVMKSISKSYGVPGVRLGVLASSNEEMIAYIKKDVSIWNINSYGEFYLQIKEKYDKDYEHALTQIRNARASLVNGLKTIVYLTPFPSEANYIMCEVKKGKSSTLASKLIERNILIKDLTQKVNNGKEYIRIAVRNEADNQVLLNALREIEP